MTKQLDDLFAEMSRCMESIQVRMKDTVEGELNKMEAKFNEKANDIGTIKRDYKSELADMKKKYNKELQAMKSKCLKLEADYKKCEKKRKALERECYKLQVNLKGSVTKDQQQNELGALRATLAAKHHEEITRLKARMKEIQDNADENIEKLNDKLEAEKKENENDEKNLEKKLQDAKKQHELEVEAALARANAAQMAKAPVANSTDVALSEKKDNDDILGAADDESDYDSDSLDLSGDFPSDEEFKSRENYSNIKLRY